MKKVLFVLLALSLFVPVACSKGGDMVADAKKVLQKATADVENLTKELDNIKGLEDMTKLQEQSQKVMADMAAAMGELQKKHGGAEPSADQQKALTEDLAKFQAAGEAFAKKAGEVAAKFAGAADTNAAPEVEGEGK